ncbi:MAG: hypothetical protein WCJ70_02000 [bacterium]
MKIVDKTCVEQANEVVKKNDSTSILIRGTKEYAEFIKRKNSKTARGVLRAYKKKLKLVGLLNQVYNLGLIEGYDIAERTLCQYSKLLLDTGNVEGAIYILGELAKLESEG